jgi:UDP-glucose 4-epimerase
VARILITGAHGFIGRHLALHLSQSGHAVCGLGHGIWPQTEAAAWGVSQWINGDIVSSNLRSLQHGTGTPDRVFHLAGGSSVGAAVANPREDFFRTVATTAELLEWLRIDAPQTRLVAVSSAAVYGAGHAGRIPENATLNPFSPYGHHKRVMEELCRSYAASYGQQVLIARLFSVYGAGLKKQLLWDVSSRLASARAAGALVETLPLGGGGDELRDWTEVRDVVRALALLAPRASTSVEVVNIGTGIGSTVRDVVSRLLAHATAGRQSPALQFSGQSRPGDPFALVAEASRLNSFGFEWRIGLDQGLQNYSKWFGEQATSIA